MTYNLGEEKKNVLMTLTADCRRSHTDTYFYLFSLALALSIHNKLLMFPQL